MIVDKQSWLQFCYEPVYITQFSVYGFEQYFKKNELIIITGLRGL